MYLQKYLTYRDVLYLKKILERFCFDHLKCNALEDRVWGVEIKMRVHFFLRHPLYVDYLFQGRCKGVAEGANAPSIWGKCTV